MDTLFARIARSRPAWLVAVLLAAGCAASQYETTAAVYTERGADGSPLEVVIVFDADGRVLGTRSEVLAAAP
ncbi:hypothetical protein CKO44_22320 [Rubrivivax gelatinosus]|uniref:Lipoprotein n=1 Tax=Rubrivivax gelatinosus TaxID=28068 RepID=A0ABS1E2T8_RUBGE|nr:hypothetical protein [Rubrivivax gelatinosus]MBK1616194.1 hypothetical protein [Rubrivivax gelatinosus]MBK1715217.1 hypothetical protein [Rubrivivax gelatinosus]